MNGFGRGFRQGFFVAIIIVSLVLGSQYGWHFTFLSDDGLTILPTFGTALNWKTAIIVSLAYLIIDRNQGSYLIPVFAWSLFGNLWLYKHSLMGSYLFGSNILTFPTSRQLIIGYGRNLILLILSISSIKQMKLSLTGKISFIITGLYWLLLFYPLFGAPIEILGILRKLVYTQIIYYAANLAPFIVCFKEWTRKTWKQFLYC